MRPSVYELETYWNRVMQHRMAEDYEVERLLTYLKGCFVESLVWNAQQLPTQEDYPKELLDYHDSKRPYGNKDIPASIAFVLGWDYKRQLCFDPMPQWVEDEAMKLHGIVKQDIVRGW